MTREEAIKELEEDKALYMPKEWIESLDRDTPDGRLITALEMAIKALEQEPCEDETVLRFSKGSLKYSGNGYIAYKKEWLKEHFDTEREIVLGKNDICKDAVSRQAVKNYKYHRTMYPNFEDYVDLLPPVYPARSKGKTRPKGKWIDYGERDVIYHCSVCKESVRGSYYKFCPYCGADMRGDNNEND